MIYERIMNEQPATGNPAKEGTPVDVTIEEFEI
jgi:hypothetical protein